MLTRLAVLALAASCGSSGGSSSDPGTRDGATEIDAPLDSAPADASPADLGPTPDLGPDVPPAGWICNLFYYGDGFDCDCGCGVDDPDCAGAGCADASCCDDTSCFPAGCDYCGPASFLECDGLADDCNAGMCQGVTCVAVPEPLGTFCYNGVFCDGDFDECDGSGNCVGTTNPCLGHDSPPNCEDSCDESAGDCIAADASGTSCDEDGNSTFGMCSGSLGEPNCVGD